MKQKTLYTIFLTGALFSMLHAADFEGCCRPAERGPPGPPGSGGLVNTFASNYTQESDVEISSGEQIPLELVNSNANVTPVPPYQLRIVEAGLYFVVMGVSDNSDLSNPAVSLFTNGSTEVPGSRLQVRSGMRKLTSVSFMSRFSANDLIDIRSVAAFSWTLGTGNSAPAPVTAYLSLFKIAP